MDKFSNIPVFIPHFGCNNDCVFCNQRSITGKIKEPNAEDVKNAIDTFLGYLKNRKAYIAFFGGSFTGIDIEKQREYLSVAAEYISSGKVCGIRISTRPDYISEGILNMLKEYGVTNIELGVQSMCDDVLKASNRGHSAQDVIRASALIKKHGFTLGLQMMPGLPGDSEEKTLYTAEKIVSLGADEARVYPTCVIKNTALYDMYENGLYTPLTLEEAVEISAKAVKTLRAGGVKVIRCGLQRTDTIGDEIVAGGYHCAFGEMVESRILRDFIEDKVRDGISEFRVNKSEVSKYLGHKRCNAEYFREKYNIEIKLIIQ